jgi:hypothetical protein
LKFLYFTTLYSIGILAGVFAIYQKDIVGIMESVFVSGKRIEGKYPQVRTML